MEALAAIRVSRGWRLNHTCLPYRSADRPPKIETGPKVGLYADLKSWTPEVMV